MVDYLVSDDFKTAGGTGVPTGISTGAPLPETAVAVEESPVVRWLRSELAQRYQGLWVLLSPSMEPQDNDLSPSALKERNPDPPEGCEFVFVPATSVQLGV